MAKLCNYDKTKKFRVSKEVRHFLFLLALAIIFNTSHTCFGDEAALQKAWVYYLRGDYEKALDTCRKLSTNKVLGEEGRYIMGLSFLKLGDYPQARKNFEFLLENYSTVKRREQILLGIADSYYLGGEFEKAEQCYVELLKAFSDTDYASIAYLRLGLCQKNQGKWQEAVSSFSKVVRDFPLSLEAEAARDCLKDKTSCFSVQVGAFSKRENAQRLADLLIKKGYDAYIEKTCHGDKLIYRVRVGKFNTRNDAQQEAAELKKEGLAVRICT